MPRAASSAAMTRMTRCSWYGAVGAPAIRPTVARVSSISGKRVIEGEDILGAVLTLYDARRRVLAPFRPRRPVVTLYVCGVTPYDTTHLGHARTFLVFDVLVRLLEARGRTVRYAQNVTDIDESILQRAERDHANWRELGRREERMFLDDMRGLRWRRPDVMPHATRELPAMRDLIERLRRRGYAYPVDGSVYFDVSRDAHYGELSRLSPSKMRRILAAQDDAALEDPRRRD